MLVITAVPANMWHQAQHGPVYRGFDPNLLSVNEQNDYATKPGTVLVSPNAIQIGAEAGSIPSVHLLTTSARSFDVSVKVRIDQVSGNAIPLRIGLWSPYTKSGYFLAFDAAPGYAISSESVVDGMLGQTLTGGSVTREVLGRYLPGQTYDLAISVNKKAGRIAYTLSGADLASPIHVSTIGSDPNRLANELRLTLTASAASSSGTSRASLQDYQLTLPTEAGGAVKIDDSRATVLLGTLAVAGWVLLIVAAAGWRPNKALAWLLARMPSRRRLLVGAGVMLAVGVANAALFRLGAAPFDMTSQEIWSYLAALYGVASVYVLGPFVSVAKAFNGMPLDAALFPYEPVTAYLFAFDGLVSRLIGRIQIEFLIKAVNVAFGLIDALLIFGILKKLGISARWSMAGAALFILALVARPRRNLAAGSYMPIVAMGMSGFLMFLTGLAATHFILALPFILLSRKWLGPFAYLSIVVGWSVTTLIAMYGILALELVKADYLHATLFDPNRTI